jgi:hypothetical protein
VKFHPDGEDDDETQGPLRESSIVLIPTLRLCMLKGYSRKEQEREVLRFMKDYYSLRLFASYIVTAKHDLNLIFQHATVPNLS